MLRRLCLTLLLTAAPGVRGDDSLPSYKPRQQVSGKIRIWGHGALGKDFIGTLVTNWEKGFQRYQPGVQFEDKLYGTASAIGALYTGTGELALLGREIWPGEIAAFEEVMHYPPLGIDVVTGSYDARNKDFALMAFVHKDNPLSKLSLPQLSGVFGCGNKNAGKEIHTWGDLGLSGEWADKPIHVYGFEISRGFGYFFEQTVFGGSSKWNPALVEFADQKQPDGTLVDAGMRILDALANDRYGIAYSNIRYANPDVRAVALAATDGGEYVTPTKDNVRNRSYPLTRVIPVFLNRAPGQPVEPKISEFLRYIVSREGQAAVAADGGYLPLTGPAARNQLKKLD